MFGVEKYFILYFNNTWSHPFSPTVSPKLRPAVTVLAGPKMQSGADLDLYTKHSKRGAILKEQFCLCTVSIKERGNSEGIVFGSIANIEDYDVIRYCAIPLKLFLLHNFLN